MIEQQRPIIITRENYHAFTKEKDLSKEEWATWREMRAKLHAGDVEMEAFINSHTEEKKAESDRAAICQTSDWLDMVHFHDAGCVLQRAQLRAYSEWLEQEADKIRNVLNRARFGMLIEEKNL